MTSSIRIAQGFPKLVGKTTRATLKVYRGMLKYMITYALYLAHYDAYFHINDDAKTCHKSFYILLLIHFNCSHIKYCKKYVLQWIH